MSITVYDENGDEVAVRTHKIVCPRCRGGGKHVNPAVDGNGITSDMDCYHDPDFWDDYLGGLYDVTCERCGGANVVDTPDEDDPNYHLWVEQERMMAEDRAVQRAEMGYQP